MPLARIPELRLNMKKTQKSFGLIEAIAASTIIVLVVSSAVALASSSMRSAALDQSYLEAENIAEEILETIQEKKAQGQIFFVSSGTVQPTAINIACYDVAKLGKVGCEDDKTGIDTSASLESNYRPYKSMTINPAFGEGFFSFKIETQINPNIVSADVADADKTALVKIDIKWQDLGGEKHYYARQLFTDWER